MLIGIPPTNSRFFAIPILGYLARYLLLIPHLLVLLVGYILLPIVLIVNAIVVLITGRAVGFYYAYAGGMLRWGTRLGAYFLGLTDRYPPFRFSN